MERHVGKRVVALLFVTTLFVGTMSGALDVWAQEGDSLAKQIQGTWMLVSMYNEQDGKKTEPFGPSPRGVHVYAPDGHFYSITMRASLPKFASNNRLKGTPEEYQAVVQGSMAYFGTYKVVSEKEHLVSLHMEASTFANWEGEDMTRVMVVVGDEERVLLVPSGERSLNLRAFQRGRGNRLPRPLLISRSARRISLLNQNIPRSSAARTPFL